MGWKEPKTRTQARQPSLQNSIFLSLVWLAMVFSAIVGTISFLIYRNWAIHQIGQARENVLIQVSERTQNIKNSMVALSNLYYYDQNVNRFLNQPQVSQQENVELAQELKMVDEKYEKAFGNMGFTYTIRIAASNGLDFNSGGSHTAEEPYEKLITNLWYTNVLAAQGNNYWVCSYESPAEDGSRTIFSAVRQILSKDGSVSGLIMINADEQSLYQTYENILPERGNLYIVDERGGIVSSNRRSMVGVKYFHAERLKGLFEAENYTIVDEAGTEMFLCRHVISEGSWTILEEIPTSHLFTSISDYAIRIILIFVLLLPLLFIVAFMHAKKTTKPLIQFRHDMQCVEQGDMDYISQIIGWKEIGDISSEFNRMVTTIRSLMEGIKTKEQLKRKAELDFLQAQINPHFVYNTLFSARCLIAMQKNAEADAMLGDYIELLRMIFNNSQEKICLSQEMEYLQKYVNILKYRYGDGINLIIDADEETMPCEIPKLLLQPFVENSIFHGILPNGGEGTIMICCQHAEDALLISIEDDGCGISEEVLEKLRNRLVATSGGRFNGVGISGAEQRIRLYYGNAYGIRFCTDVEVGTKIEIRLPFLPRNPNDIPK